jgi:selenocysteine lyase/cysteine desulfurase
MSHDNRSRRRFLKNMTLGGAMLTSVKHLEALSYGTPHPLSPKNSLNEAYWNSIRSKFLLASRKKYFNTASLGASPKVVIDTVYEWMMRLEGMGEAGFEQREGVHNKLAAFVNCDPNELAITRNTTEGINIMARSIPFEAGDEVIVTSHAHVGGAAPWLAVQNDKGIKVKVIDLDNTGKNNLDIITSHITKRTRAIAISHVTCTTGMVLPIKELIEYCRKKEIYTCIDGAHPLGMMRLDLNDLKPDFYASSGHKWLLGPKGTGILYINKDTIARIKPFYAGAHSDKYYDLKKGIFEHGLTAHREEYGTRNTPILMGLGAAVDFINSIGIVNVEHRGKELAGYLKNELSTIPKVKVITPMDSTHSASIVTFSIEGYEYSKAQIILQKKTYSRLRGIHENDLNALRVSCAVYNSKEELEVLLKSIRSLV